MEDGEKSTELSDGKYSTASPDINDLCSCINTKISYIKKSLQLRKIDQEPSLKTVLGKIAHEMFLLTNILNKLELEFHHQERQQSQLKELQESIERDYQEAQHLGENMPIHLPRAIPNSTVSLTVEQCKDVEAARGKKPAKDPKSIKEASFITAEEFENVPAYMRGRLSYNQVNAVIQEINKAVVSKYKIMRQSSKAMSSAIRNLYFRFQEEETKDTKGEFFIVEADIEEFTQLKADKRFHSILTILRHCKRVREIRGSCLVRYAVC
ncbi:spindle and kinetochore-associated protein 1 [Rhineura floridana]|uniref:spindle and kinetochore-associated protein 1 n=1 Tax=Rhineura floridana TaxID=261503 RepID=UPI002AC88E3C|nr:spindle and kinetochore-associated protein 1 [Rhineura floridana]